MAKKIKTDVRLTCLTIYVMLLPLVGSAADKKAVGLLFTALSLIALGISVMKEKKLVFSKTAMFFALASVFALAAVFYTSNKGGQFYFFAVIMQTAVIALVCTGADADLNREKVKKAAAVALYYSAVLYAVFAVLYQIFISQAPLLCRMDFGRGASYGASALMTAGVLSAWSIYRGKKKSAAFFAAVLLMVYVYVFARSFTGFLVTTAIIFIYSLRDKKRIYLKAAAFAAFFAAAIGEALSIAQNFKEVLVLVKAAFYGLASVFGTGAGGYNAVYDSVGTGYAGSPTVIVSLLESMGIIGLLLAGAAFWGAFGAYAKNKSLSHLAAAAILTGAFFAQTEHIHIILPLMGIYYALDDEKTGELKSGVLPWVFYAAGAFLLYMTAARLPYALGNGALADGDRAAAAEYFETAARMELFSSEGWAKAYEASRDEYEESGKGLEKCQIYIENAISFDKKNIVYKKALADVYTAGERHGDALNVWDKIIAQFDSERLYPELSEKIYNVMKEKTAEPDYEKQLYERLMKYAVKAKNGDIIKEVNDIAARSQRFYVASIEGVTAPGDMYSDPTEPESETETEAE